MKHVIQEAKVLVASDNADDARQIQRQLKAKFANVQLSTNPDRSLEDFEQNAPAVLVPAFDARHFGELDRLIGREIDAAEEQAPMEAGGAAVDVWARRLKGVIEPALAGARVLTEEIRHIRPLVMVVEDDEFARSLVSHALDPLAWETMFAADGATALAHLRRHRPDVILMDMHLPGVDGVALTQRLKTSPHLAGIPVVMMTGVRKQGFTHKQHGRRLRGQAIYPGVAHVQASGRVVAMNSGGC